MKQHISGISIAHSRELDNRLSLVFKVFPMWLLGPKLGCVVGMVVDSIPCGKRAKIPSETRTPVYHYYFKSFILFRIIHRFQSLIKIVATISKFLTRVLFRVEIFDEAMYSVYKLYISHLFKLN